MISFTAWVEVPPGAEPAASDTATIQATSVTSPSITAEATLNTTVTSGELAYVTYEGNNYLSTIDTVLHIPLTTIDLAQYGCNNYKKETKLTPDGAISMCLVEKPIRC
jgi:hypothetical protein